MLITEYAASLQRIIDNGTSAQEIARRFDRTLDWVIRKLSLNDLIPEAKALVDNHTIDVTAFLTHEKADGVIQCYPSKN